MNSLEGTDTQQDEHGRENCKRRCERPRRGILGLQLAAQREAKPLLLGHAAPRLRRTRECSSLS